MNPALWRLWRSPTSRRWEFGTGGRVSHLVARPLLISPCSPLGLTGKPAGVGRHLAPGYPSPANPLRRALPGTARLTQAAAGQFACGIEDRGARRQGTVAGTLQRGVRSGCVFGAGALRGSAVIWTLRVVVGLVPPVGDLGRSNTSCLGTVCFMCVLPPSAKICQCRVLRDVIPPTPPGPEGSNGNGLVRAQ